VFQEVKAPRFHNNGTGMQYGCQPYSPAAFTPKKYSWYSFLLEAESTPGPQCDRKDFMSMKNPLTSAGIEPATFRFVAQHLNHCATAVPRFSNWETKIDCAVLPKKTGTIPATYVDSSDWGIPEGLVLADEEFQQAQLHWHPVRS